MAWVLFIALIMTLWFKLYIHFSVGLRSGNEIITDTF